MKDIITAPFMAEMIHTTTNMYGHGWDERNGGNISLMLDEKDIAEYLNTDSTIIRLVFALLVLGWGSGVLAYIACALILPEGDEEGNTEE